MCCSFSNASHRVLLYYVNISHANTGKIMGSLEINDYMSRVRQIILKTIWSTSSWWVITHMPVHRHKHIQRQVTNPILIVYVSDSNWFLYLWFGISQAGICAPRWKAVLFMTKSLYLVNSVFFCWEMSEMCDLMNAINKCFV